MYSTPLHFTNGSFKLMQISDIQELAKINPDSIKLLTLALRREKPDLAVFTGDQVYGIHPSFRLGDTRQKIAATIRSHLAYGNAARSAQSCNRARAAAGESPRLRRPGASARNDITNEALPDTGRMPTGQPRADSIL